MGAIISKSPDEIQEQARQWHQEEEKKRDDEFLAELNKEASSSNIL